MPGNLFRITRDPSANLKLLKLLEKKGFIEIHDVLIENGRTNKKVNNKILPVGEFGHALWGKQFMRALIINIWKYGKY